MATTSTHPSYQGCTRRATASTRRRRTRARRSRFTSKAARRRPLARERRREAQAAAARVSHRLPVVSGAQLVAGCFRRMWLPRWRGGSRSILMIPWSPRRREGDGGGAGVRPSDSVEPCGFRSLTPARRLTRTVAATRACRRRAGIPRQAVLWRRHRRHADRCSRHQERRLRGVSATTPDRRDPRPPPAVDVMIPTGVLRGERAGLIVLLPAQLMDAKRDTAAAPRARPPMAQPV